MEWLKKIFEFLKNISSGLLFVAMTCGFFLLLAAAMLYYGPQDFFGEAALFPRNPNRDEVKLALRILRYAIPITVGSALLVWLIAKAEALAQKLAQRLAARKAAKAEAIEEKA
jgi:hypothetical protein